MNALNETTILVALTIAGSDSGGGAIIRGSLAFVVGVCCDIPEGSRWTPTRFRMKKADKIFVVEFDLVLIQDSH